jgi:hypothetical protein
MIVGPGVHRREREECTVALLLLNTCKTGTVSYASKGKNNCAMCTYAVFAFGSFS